MLRHKIRGTRPVGTKVTAGGPGGCLMLSTAVIPSPEPGGEWECSPRIRRAGACPTSFSFHITLACGRGEDARQHCS